MPRITKVYTRTGDDGTTALGIKTRVAKDSARVEAYGTVDELNSFLGMVLAGGVVEALASRSSACRTTSSISAPISAFPRRRRSRCRCRASRSGTCRCSRPGWTPGPKSSSRSPTSCCPGRAESAARLQVARAVCRRAERRVVTLQREEPVGPFAVQYLNRLSDALFVAARYENAKRGVAEPLWDSRSVQRRRRIASKAVTS